MIKIYVAGPYTQGDTALNVARAIEMAESIWMLDCIPFVPHLTHFWHLIHQHSYEEWLSLDMVWLEACDGLFRLSGPSIGADREVQRMIELDRPVFEHLEGLKAWLGE